MASRTQVLPSAGTRADPPELVLVLANEVPAPPAETTLPNHHSPQMSETSTEEIPDDQVFRPVKDENGNPTNNRFKVSRDLPDDLDQFIEVALPKTGILSCFKVYHRQSQIGKKKGGDGPDRRNTVLPDGWFQCLVEHEGTMCGEWFYLPHTFRGNWRHLKAHVDKQHPEHHVAQPKRVVEQTFDPVNDGMDFYVADFMEECGVLPLIFLDARFRRLLRPEILKHVPNEQRATEILEKLGRQRKKIKKLV